MDGTNVDRLQAASGRLGEAVLDPAAWPVVMEEICAAARASAACLLQSDIRTPDVPMTASAADMFRSYFHNQLNVGDVRAVRGVPLLLTRARVITDQDLFSSEREMLYDPLYAHLDRFGFRWFAAIGFYAGSALWGLSLQRTLREGAFHEREKLALAQLSLQLTEAATLSKAVGRVALSNMTNALHLIKQPAISLDRFGFVIDVNATAMATFDNEIFIRGQSLFVRDKKARSVLAMFADRLRTTPDTAVLPVAPIVVRRETKPPVIIRILPVDGAARSPFLGARAILVLSDLSLTSSPPPNLLSQAFLLSPAEARLAALIATGISLEEAADRIGISRETTRSQLKAIFSKTGTNRQSALVALMSRIE